MRPLAVERGLELKAVYGDLLRMDTDEDKLRQILINFLSNAVKFTDHGEIELAAAAVGDRLRFSVRDTGVGIAPEVLPYIFEKFRQADGSSTRRFEGTGLGLAICRSLAEILGGEITVESQVGQGSTFILTFPRPAQGSGRRRTDSMGNAVLLAVDDRPDNLFVLEQLMAAYLSDIKLLTAPSAEAGLKLAASENIDGALIDVQMPVMNGIEMCRRLKADPLTAPIHIILMTAHRCTSTLKAQGLEAGADDFLTKPIDNVELAAKLRVMLRLRAAEHALRRERDHLEETVQERTQELREAEYRFRTLFNAASDAIFFNDLEGRLLEVNDEACRLLGYRREELLRLRVTDLVPPEIAARRPELLKRLRAAGHLLFETEHLCRDGGRIPIECSSRIIDFQGLPGGVVHHPGYQRTPEG